VLAACLLSAALPWGVPSCERTSHTEEAAFAWKLWSLEWVNATPGEPTITARQQTQGQVQPAKEAPRIAKKQMYWERNGQVSRWSRPA
jgi:hypothetical protein